MKAPRAGWVAITLLSLCFVLTTYKLLETQEELKQHRSIINQFYTQLDESNKKHTTEIAYLNRQVMFATKIVPLERKYFIQWHKK